MEKDVEFSNLTVFGASNVLIIKRFLPDDCVCVSFPGLTSARLAEIAGCALLPCLHSVVLNVDDNDQALLPIETRQNVTRILRVIQDKGARHVLIISKRPYTLGIPANRWVEINNSHATKDGLHLTTDSALNIAQKIIHWFLVRSER